MKLGGGNTGTVRVIAAYQPCRVTGALRNLTVFKQYLKFCNENNIDTCPLEIFKTELCSLIASW